MAQRDYVRKKAKPKNKSRIIPNLMMVIAIILVILFVAILYFVSTNKVDKPTPQQQTITEKPLSTLPDKPEERWTYLKELENPEGNQTSGQQTKPFDQEKERQQILNSFVNEKITSTNNTIIQNQVPNNNTVQTTLPTTQPIGDWLLQCGAFKEKANAESLKAKLAMLGVTSYVKSEKFYRVLVGPYNSKLEAEKIINNLKSNAISSCIITQK